MQPKYKKISFIFHILGSIFLMRGEIFPYGSCNFSPSFDCVSGIGLASKETSLGSSKDDPAAHVAAETGSYVADSYLHRQSCSVTFWWN